MTVSTPTPVAVSVGDALPVRELEITLRRLVMYAGATWDFHRLHFDDVFARAAGLESPIMDGQMVGALLARELMRWGGPNCSLRRLSYRLRHMVFLGERVRLTGSVCEIAKTPEGHEIVWVLGVTKADGVEVVRDGSAVLTIY